MTIKSWFGDLFPYRRKTAADWVLPCMIGLGVGVVAGVGFGILYAPQTGEEARLRLREGAARVRERAADLAGRARGQMEAASSQIQSELSHS